MARFWVKTTPTQPGQPAFPMDPHHRHIPAVSDAVPRFPTAVASPTLNKVSKEENHPVDAPTNVRASALAGFCIGGLLLGHSRRQFLDFR